MLNQTILVGRLVADPEINVTENDFKQTTITLAVPRDYKNVNGEYDTDFIPCTLWRSIAENTTKYCIKGDLIGVKGHLQCADNKMVVIAEKVTFLSTRKEEKED